MNNFSVAMIDTRTNTAYQLERNIEWEVAHNMVVDLRCKRDGNRYWIGRIEWLNPYGDQNNPSQIKV
jgi:hypothetical protein